MTTPAILRDVAPLLRTSRLLLRCPQPGDGPALQAAVVESLAALRAWPASLPWALAEPTVDASETFCRESAAAFIQRRELHYLAFDDSGAVVASVGLHHIDWAVPRFELGFWCRASRQRQGLASEAARALVGQAFRALGARRVEALPDEANAASRAVCQAAGLRLEGVMRNERIAPDGTLRHTCVYAAYAADAASAATTAPG